MSEEDFDIEEELGDGTFSIPHHSVSNQLKKIDKHQDDDMKVYITAVVSMLKGYEYNYLKRRYKSFDLIQNEELCDRYYKDVVITIEKEGLELSLLLSSTNDAISSQDVIRKLAQNFVNIYIPLKQKTQNVSYPWPTYDDDVQLSCLQLMQRNETAKSRSYMLGYFETVSRIPIIDQSEQGKIFTNSIAWALGRHPFGTYFTKIVIAVKSILHRVRLELSSGEDLCTKVRMIIDQTTQIWLWSWSKFEAAKLQIELAELLKECFQHIIFLAIPTLCQVFLNTSSYLALHAHENPFQRQNISFRSSGISDDSVIMKSNMNEVTAQLVSPSDSIRSATGSIQPTSAAIANTSDSRKPDSRSTSNQSLIIDSHPVVALETPFAVPIYNTADSMDGNDIVIANATVVDSTLSSVPIIACTTSSIQSQVVASGEALQHAYNTFSHSYTSVVPSQLAAPTPAVVLSSITNPYVPRSAVHFNRIIAIDELEEICGIPPRFRSMMLCQGTGNRTDINQVSEYFSF